MRGVFRFCMTTLTCWLMHDSGFVPAGCDSVDLPPDA